MSWPDIVALGLIVLLAVAGWHRGFWSEVVGMFGVGLAFVLSAWLTPILWKHLPQAGGSWGAAERGVLFFLLFSGFAGMAALFARRGSGGKDSGQVAGLEQWGGVLAGGIRGVFLAGFFYLLILQPMFPAKAREGMERAPVAATALSLDAVIVQALSDHLPHLKPYSEALMNSMRRCRNSSPGTRIV